MRRPPPQAQPRTPAPTGAPDAPAPLRGSEVAGLAESLYLRLFVLALGSLPLICGLAVVAALVRTHNADLLRTTALAAALAALAALALRAPVRAYRALRRRPLFSLGAPLVALTALTLDGVTYSPLSYPAAVSIAIPAFVCGRRWALAAATIISVGALTAATVRYGFGVIDAVGQGTAGYFVWALVLAGLAERFAHLAMQLAPVAPPPTDRPPPILVSTPNRDSSSAAPEPSRVRAPTAGTAAATPTATACLTARQLQVLALLADGLRAEDIAGRLGITTTTVYRHIERAKQRTGLRSLSELVAVVVRAEMLRQAPAD